MKENRFKNYIVFWLSQSISQLGSSMTSFALTIWAYKQINSAMTVSLMIFCSYLPYIIISIFAGTFVDNHKKKTIMLWSDSIAAICSIVVLILAFANKLEIMHIYIHNFIIGFMNSFQAPAESVAIGMMVSKDKYFKISGLNSFSNSLLAVVTPMLAVFISSFVGLQGVIMFDLITFIFAFIILLLFIKISEKSNEKINRQYGVLYGCKEGMAFLLNNKGIFYMIISMAFLNFFSRLTYENILAPMILSRSDGSNYILGTISGILGIGGVIGGIIVSVKKFINDSIKLIYFSAAFSFLFGDLFMGLGQTTFVWCIAAIMTSVPIPFIDAGQNIIMYNTIPKKIQGRVFAVRNAVQFCTIPIGIILGGFLASYVFEPFIKSNNIIALNLQKIVGSGTGSGMAVMFLCTGILGTITSILWYKNKYIRKLKDINMK